MIGETELAAAIRRRRELSAALSGRPLADGLKTLGIDPDAIEEVVAEMLVGLSYAHAVLLVPALYDGLILGVLAAREEAAATVQESADAR